MGYAQRLKLSQSRARAKVESKRAVLTIELDLKTRHVKANVPDDYDVAMQMLHATAVLVQKKIAERDAAKPKVVAPKVVGVTAAQARGMGLKLVN